MSSNLYVAAEACLASREVDRKCRLAEALWQDWREGRLHREGEAGAPCMLEAGRPARIAATSRASWRNTRTARAGCG